MAEPCGIAFSPTEPKAFVTLSQPNRVAVIDTTTHPVTGLAERPGKDIFIINTTTLEIISIDDRRDTALRHRSLARWQYSLGRTPHRIPRERHWALLHLESIESEWIAE